MITPGVTRGKLQTPGTAEEHNTNKEHLQSGQTTGTRHNSQTKHRAPSKEQPNSQSHNTDQHSNPQPSSHRPSRIIPEPSQPTQPSVRRRRAEPHYNTDTTRTSGELRLAVCRIILSLKFTVVAFDLVSVGPHCFLQLSSAGLMVVLVPGCCSSSFSFSV